MIFFRYLFYNQYAEITRRGGDGSKAQLNTILLSTVLATLYIVFLLILYDKFHPGFIEKNFSLGGMDGKSIGRLLGGAIGLIIFFFLKAFICNKRWFKLHVGEFEGMSREEQDRVSKKGLKYFFIASLPVITAILWALISVF